MSGRAITLLVRSRDSLLVHVHYFTTGCKAIAGFRINSRLLSSWQEFGGPLSEHPAFCPAILSLPKYAALFLLSPLDLKIVVSREIAYRNRASIVMISYLPIPSCSSGMPCSVR